MTSVLFALALSASDPQVIPLWPNGAPGSESRMNEPETKPNPWSIGNIYNPGLTVYLPPKEKANGTAIIVAPGGGHRELVVGEEGTKPAQYLSQLGVTVFVLKYRLAREKDSGLTIEKDTRADTYRAVRLVRSRAQEFGINPNKVGFLGFSAGGEVVSMAAFSDGKGSEAGDAVDKLSPKPDFAMWIYPGPLGIPEQVPADAPKGFVLVAADDGLYQTAISLSTKYHQAKVPLELHVLASGGHGFNMGDRSKLRSVSTWPQRLADWLTDNVF